MNHDFEIRSIKVAKWLALLILNHEVPGLNPTGGVILLLTVQCFIAESFSLSPIVSI